MSRSKNHLTPNFIASGASRWVTLHINSIPPTCSILLKPNPASIYGILFQLDKPLSLSIKGGYSSISLWRLLRCPYPMLKMMSSFIPSLLTYGM